MKILRREEGTILVGIVFAMVLLTLMGVAGAAMFVNTTRMALNVQAMGQSHALAVGGTEYVLRQLEDDLDWTNGTDLKCNTLGGHPFTVTWQNGARNYVEATVQSRVTYGQFEEAEENTRNYRFAVIRLPRAFLYGLFWGGSGGGGPVSLTGMTMKGNHYVGGDTAFSSSTVEKGKVFYKSGASVTGIDADKTRAVPDPQPKMPLYNTAPEENSYENDIQTVYHPAIQTAHDQPSDGDLCPTSDSDLVITSNFTVPSGTTTCRDIRVLAPTNIEITGTGTLVAWRDVHFQTPTADDCVYNDEAFRSSDDGCKKLLAPSKDTVWSAQQADNSQPSALGACQALGWDLPTDAQLVDARNGGAEGHIAFTPGSPAPGQFFWSQTDGAAAGEFMAVDMSTGAGAPESRPETETHSVLCVKAASASNLGKTTVVPDGGPIEIIAGRSIIKSDDRKGLDVQKGAEPTERVVFYGANATLETLINLPLNINGQVFFSGSPSAYGTTTRFSRSRVMATRNLRFMGGADMLDDGFLYVRNYSLDPLERNFLDLVDAATEIDGSVISVSPRDPSLRILNASVTGIAYARGSEPDEDEGRALLAGAKITGSVVLNRFTGDAASDLVVDNTDAGAYPGADTPDGFSTSASMKPQSWDGI